MNLPLWYTIDSEKSSDKTVKLIWVWEMKKEKIQKECSEEQNKTILSL